MGVYINKERAYKNIRRKGRYCKTQKDVAERLGVSLRTLHRWQETGLLPFLSLFGHKHGLIVYRETKVFVDVDGRISYDKKPFYDAIAILEMIDRNK